MKTRKRAYFVFKGKRYFVANKLLWEQPGGIAYPVNFPSEELREEAKKYGFTGTIAEKTDFFHTHGGRQESRK